MQQDFGNDSPRSLRSLCPTRWTVKHKTFQSVLVNYEPLLETLDSVSSGLDGNSCLEVRSKAGGIHRTLQTFECLFGMMLSERFFGITDSLSSSLQGKNVTTFDAKNAAETVSKKLLSPRSDTEFDLFWTNNTSRAQELQLSEPSLPCVCRVPRRFNSGSDPHLFSSPKEYYKKAYFELADTLNEELNKRFSQKNYELYIRRLKTYLRSSMSAQRLNHVLLLHVHKDITETLDPQCIAKEFVCRNDRRKHVFVIIMSQTTSI